LPVPVFAQTMAQVTVARGAALAAAGSTDFTDDLLLAHTGAPAPAPARPRQWSYAGAVTALAAGAITFVSSVSIALGIQLAPDGASAKPNRVVHAPAPQVAEAIAPPPEANPPASRPKAPGEPVADPGATEEQAGPAAEQLPDRQPYLTRVLEHIPGDAGDAAGDSAPHAPAQP
jgi:hypothetical protein